MRSTSARNSASSPQACSRYAARAGPSRSRASAATWLTRPQRARSTLPPQLRAQPCARHRPLPLHRAGRDAEHHCGLVDVEAPEEAQLDDALLARVQRAEPQQGRVERHQVIGPIDTDRFGLVERYVRMASPALPRRALARMIDEDAPHGSGGDREEVGAVPPIVPHGPREPQVDLVRELGGLERGAGGRGEEGGAPPPIVPHGPREPQVDLVRELGGLERVPWPLAAQVRAGDTPQLGVNHGHQPLASVPVAVAQALEEQGHLVRGFGVAGAHGGLSESLATYLKMTTLCTPTSRPVETRI